MRTGGDDLAQAFALIGCRPTWDVASTRVSGFEVLPLAMLGRPRVDVTLRISGLFRDVFPSQIALFAAAVRAVAALDESAEDNPLAGLERRRPRAYSARRPALMASGSARASPAATGRIGPNWRRLISPRPATPMTARAKAREAAASFERGSPAPRLSSMCRTCRGRTCSTPTPSPSMKAASPPPRRKLGAQSGALSSRTRPSRRAEDPHLAPGDRARRCADAPPIRAGFAGQMRHGHRGAAEIAQIARQSLLLRRADRCGRQRAVRPHVRRDARRRRGARVSRRRQSSGRVVTWRACSRRRRGADSGSRAAIRARAFWPRCCREAA